MKDVDGPQFYEKGWVQDGDVLLLMNERVMGFKREKNE